MSNTQAPLLMIGGSGIVGSQAARALRRLQPTLPIAIGGRDPAMRFAQSRGLPYISLSSGSFEISPEVAQYIHAPERSPVLLASHWLVGASLYPALHYANAFRSIDEVRIGVLLDEEDIGGPAAHAGPVWIGECDESD